ncbi:hypothetical protein AGLY_003957 [Aphis glycines]|uniref:Uncharacterized protein n=1 Tax=Aphis glycines TaxID=307491 RepID=A0A6G0TWQ3_APHGL|nr:hypothetical protein AGLY_003957 [Aphis glycines]
MISTWLTLRILLEFLVGFLFDEQFPIPRFLSLLPQHSHRLPFDEGLSKLEKNPLFSCFHPHVYQDDRSYLIVDKHIFPIVSIRSCRYHGKIKFQILSTAAYLFDGTSVGAAQSLGWCCDEDLRLASVQFRSGLLSMLSRYEISLRNRFWFTHYSDQFDKTTKAPSVGYEIIT